MESKTSDAFRLSPHQRQLWPLQHASGAFRAQVAVTCEGRLDRPALERAVQQVVGRHEVLRTTFRRLHGIRVPFQVVGESANVSWRHVDWTDRQDVGGEAVFALLEEERGYPFDLEQGPVLRLCLVAFDESHHTLLATIPALCADTATMANLVREIAQAYARVFDGTEVEPAGLQYADFAAWENELLETDDQDATRTREFWGRPEAGAGAVVRLPFEAESLNDVAGEPDYVNVPVSPDVMAAAQAAAGAAGVPAATFLLAGFHALLSRLTGSVDISVLHVVSGRAFEETRDAMGLFARPVPTLTRCETDRTFEDLLHELHQKLGESDGEQDLRYSEQTDPGSVPGVLPIGFEVFEAAPPIAARDLWLRIDHIHSVIAPFKLKLTCIQRDSSWAFRFEYSPEVYERPQIERLSRHFEQLLLSAAQRLEAPLGELNVLDESDRSYLLVTLNDTAADYPRDRCIHQLFEDQVARTPSNIAVVSGDRQLTYSELNARANQLAHVLRRHGVGPDVCVGLCLERSAEMVVALLGILKAGGAYVPVSPDHPHARVSHQLTEAAVRVLITQEKFLGNVPASTIHTMCLDREARLLDEQPAANLDLPSRPEQLVYVLYTSGSTGTPKGVAVTHRNLVNYTHDIRTRLQMGSEREGVALHCAMVSTLTADLGNTVLFPSLVSGACLHVIGYELATDAAAFAQYVGKHPVDVMKIVPSHLKALLAFEPGRSILPRRYLVSGGEPLSWELVDDVSQRADCQIVNHYGPTETTVGSLVFPAHRESELRRVSRTVPIGRPIANTDVYILDERAMPVPPGVAGELHVGGMGVAVGYIGRPDLTDERFIPHPFSMEPGARLYKTGDLARYLPDGNVEFLGRRDDQVKIRGFRVELGEIEAVLLGHPAVRESVVMAREDTAGEKRLVAYIVPGELQVGSEEFRSFARDRVPDYMVPDAFVPLASLPLTRNGKVDRKALPAPDERTRGAGQAFVEPRTPVEGAVAEIWARMLRRERVGLHDNFFELGGHSLLVTQVVSRLRSQFQVDLPLRTLFEHPTVEGIALFIDEQQAHREREDSLDPMLTELEAISDEEAEKLLKSELRSDH